MNRNLAIIGFVCGVIVLVGFFSPWLELNSRPYRLEGARLKDQLKITGWNLGQGKIQVTQMVESLERLCWEKYKIIEIQVEGKSYPYLSLAGGILLVLGGIAALRFKGKAPYLIVILGGILALVGGFLGFWDNRWIRHVLITIEDYAVSGYYRYGLLLCIIGSVVSIVGCILEWGIYQIEKT